MELQSAPSIRSYLQSLPVGSERVYEEVLKKVVDNRLRNAFAARAFKWVFAAIRPLIVDELVFVVCQNPDGWEFEKSDVDIDYVLDSYGNLIRLEGDKIQINAKGAVAIQPRTVCRFVNGRIQDYLGRQAGWVAEAHGLIAMVSLMALTDRSLFYR